MALTDILTDIKSRLNALVTYANGVTGESDTSVGDAMRTLAAGYGQGGGGLEPLASGVISVSESDTQITATINRTTTGNTKGDCYITVMRFLGDLVDTDTVNRVFETICSSTSTSTAYYSSYGNNVSAARKGTTNSLTVYAAKNVIYVSNISNTALTITIPKDGTSYATYRGNWQVDCYKLINAR